MKKLIIALAVACISSIGVAAPDVDIPEDILQKQRVTLQHYGGKSKTLVSKAVAEGYSYRIGNMIKSLTQTKARFDQQIKDGGLPDNPYAKYNGIWELDGNATTAYCSDGSSAYVPAASSRARWNITPSGDFPANTVIDTSTFASNIEVIDSSVIARFSGKQWYQRAVYRLFFPDDYVHARMTAEHSGIAVNSSYIEGQAKVDILLEEYSVTCTATSNFTVRKVAN